ncbi:hypothetical protein FQA39_LY03161 [Lamprigera yunnana]|nr:hypothetical protein FQA39_LY03161 [Lamprigera yunnana]
MPETAENITEKVKLDKCQDKRYLNKEKLPIKVFTKRNSPITDLLVENKHFKSFSQLAISLWFAMVLYSVVIDYSKEKRIYLGTRTLRAGFKNLHLGFLVWIGLFVSSLLVYLGFMVWAVRRIKYFRSRQYFIVQLWDVSWLSLFLLYYPGVLYYVARMVMVYDLGMATSIAVLMEGVRFLMKCYAFVRFNCPKYKKGVNDAVKPTFSHYLYFSFAPTLLYRDTYPRSTDAIRWRCTFKWFGEMFMGIMFYSIAFENSFKNSLEDYGIRKYTWIDIMVIISKNFHIGTILGLVFFFCGIMPVTAENITEKVKLDKCQDKRYLNKEKLPVKVFTKRNSPITDLLVENKHFKSFSQLAISLWFAMVLYSVVIDYSKEKRIYLGTRTLRAGFKNLHLGFLVWIGLFVSSLLVYLGFMVWAVCRIKYFRSKQYFIVQLWDVSWLSLFLLYYPGVLYYVARMVMVCDLGIATSVAVLMEGVRFLMKCHAFVRFNSPKYKKGVNYAVKPTFSHYLYFSFAPTLLYRDTYPRSTDAIRWRYTFKWFGEVFMGIMFSSITFENSFKNALEDYGIRKYTWIDIMSSLLLLWVSLLPECHCRTPKIRRSVIL